MAIAGANIAAAAAPSGGPPAADMAAGHQQVEIDPKLLDAYAGFYLLDDKAVLTVTREGDHLSIQLTGQPAAPVFPESSTRFFAKIVDAQFDFQADPSGKVASVVLHQSGHVIPLPRTDAATARQTAARTEAKVKTQTATLGTEAAARTLDAAIAGGKPPYDAMTPVLADAVRSRVSVIQPYLAQLGPIDEVRFLGVNPQGADVYDVRHRNGIVRWMVALNAEGKISSALVTQGP